MSFQRLICLSGVLLALAPDLNAADWPQWRGPRRDGVCDETALLQQWPEGGPKLLWSATNLGRGYSAPIIVGKNIFLTGDVDEELRIFALDLDGKLLWRATNGLFWKNPYPGARASCTFSDGRLYHLNAHGRVVCLDAKTGNEVWAVNILERFGGKNITWGLSENLLVDGGRVIVTPGGGKGVMAALDKKTGATVWAGEPLKLGKTSDPAHERMDEPFGEVDSASYTSPVLLNAGSRRMIVNCSQRHVFGVDAGSGKMLWSRPLETRYDVIATTPVVVNDGVFVTAPDGEGGKLYRVKADGDSVSVETVWRTDLDACQGGAVFKDGRLHGAMYRKRREWVSLDAKTGELRAQLLDFAKGSVLYADQRLYCFGEDGEMALVKPAAENLEIVGRFKLVPERKSDAWAHPVIANGRLYLRYHGTLFCYDVRAEK